MASGATRTYLEMRSLSQLQPAPVPAIGLRIEEVRDCPPAFWRFLYEEVGRDYRWTDRLGWTDGDIRAYLTDSSVTLWLLSVEGAPAGYFELRREPDDSIEIAYFGLLRHFLGRHLGGHLLTEAVRQAWRAGATRVWLHTCSLDHPAALPNYLRRGFVPFRTERYEVGETQA